jgi:SAM-dependent methyltransferase
LLAIFALSIAAQPSSQAVRTPDVPYVPTSNVLVHAMLKLAGVSSADVVYDLGCGDGRIVITAARDFGARGVGIDINPARIQDARHNAEQAGVTGKVRFEENDLFKADIKDATVVTLYLLTGVNERLRPKLMSELKPGTRIVSNTFKMGDWKPDKVERIDGREIMLWTVPARASGK